MRILLLAVLVAALAIPAVSLADPTIYTDRVAWGECLVIMENYGFEDWPTGTFSYPGDPWTTHGITYRCTNNLIAGAGVSPFYPLSNVFLNNYWTPILADVDPVPQYIGLGFEASDLTYDAVATPMNFVIHTNLGSFAFNGLPVPRSMDSFGQFYGWIAGPGEYFTGFEMASIGSPHAAALDNVTLALPGPSATDATTWGALKSTFR